MAECHLGEMELGKLAYDAARETCPDWPAWELLSDKSRLAWAEGAQAVASHTQQYTYETIEAEYGPID